MAARDPTLERDEPDVGPVSRREWAGYIVWGILAVVVTAFELLAWRGTDIPFPTLSETAGNLRSATTGRRCRFWPVSSCSAPGSSSIRGLFGRQSRERGAVGLPR